MTIHYVQFSPNVLPLQQRKHQRKKMFVLYIELFIVYVHIYVYIYSMYANMYFICFNMIQYIILYDITLYYIISYYHITLHCLILYCIAQYIELGMHTILVKAGGSIPRKLRELLAHMQVDSVFSCRCQAWKSLQSLKFAQFLQHIETQWRRSR